MFIFSKALLSTLSLNCIHVWTGAFDHDMASSAVCASFTRMCVLFEVLTGSVSPIIVSVQRWTSFSALSVWNIQLGPASNDFPCCQKNQVNAEVKWEVPFVHFLLNASDPVVTENPQMISTNIRSFKESALVHQTVGSQ